MATQTVIRSSTQLYIDANLDFHSKQAINLASGVLATDGVNLGQVQSLISTAVSGVGSSIHVPVQNVAAAVAVIATDRQDKMIMLIEDFGLYHYDAQSLAVSNNGAANPTVIRPTDLATDSVAGRWIKMSSVMTDHSMLSNLQGGDGTSQYYHLTLAEYTSTGSGTFVRQTSPVLTTPSLGVASATSINGLTITASTGTFTLANTKVLTVNNTLTFTGTDSTSFAFPTTSGTLALVTQTFTLGSTSIAINGSVSAILGMTGVGFTNSTYNANVISGTLTGNITLTLPNLTGTIIATSSVGLITGTMIANTTITDANISATAAIAITKLAASTISGVSLGGSLLALTLGTNGLVATTTTYNGSVANSVDVDLTKIAGLTNVLTMTNKTLTTPTLTTPVINGTPTGTGVAVAATINTLVLRDANGNATFNNSLDGYSTTVMAGTTTVFAANSAYWQFFTGSGATAQTITLPVTSTLALGQAYRICNNTTGTGVITVNSSGSNTVIILASGADALVTCILTSGTTAASWDVRYLATSVTSGKVFAVQNSLIFAGNDGATLNIGAGGTLGTAAYATIANYALIGQTMYIGTTAVAINRTSAALALTGITSIDGLAATATILATTRTINGVGFNGSANITITSSTTAALTAGTGITSTGIFDGSTARTFALDTSYLGNNYSALVGSRRTYRMIPTTGTINGSNQVFTFNPPIVAQVISGTEEIFLNGLLMNAGGTNDYTVTYSGTTPFTMTVTFLTAPSNTPFIDIILANFSV
jgi:hypothetical protein